MEYIGILNFIVPLGFMIGLIVIISLSAWAGKKEQYEMDLKELYKAKCSAFIFPNNHTWPFVRISIYENEIVVRIIKQYRIYMKNIYRVEKVNGTFVNGFKIFSSQTGIPQSITIWVNDVDRVVEIISSSLKSKESDV